MCLHAFMREREEGKEEQRQGSADWGEPLRAYLKGLCQAMLTIPGVTVLLQGPPLAASVGAT